MEGGGRLSRQSHHFPLVSKFVVTSTIGAICSLLHTLYGSFCACGSQQPHAPGHEILESSIRGLATFAHVGLEARDVRGGIVLLALER